MIFDVLRDQPKSNADKIFERIRSRSDVESILEDPTLLRQSIRSEAGLPMDNLSEQKTALVALPPIHSEREFELLVRHPNGYPSLIGVFDRFTKAKARNGRGYRLLITDGHSSHINMDFLEWCDQHRIIVAVFPPHSTHRLQPLDVSLFSPLSTANQLVRWTAKTQGAIRLSKREFWTLFWSAFEASFSPENIASGWRRTGLLPFDPQVVLSQIANIEEEDPATGSDSADSLSLSNNQVT